MIEKTTEEVKKIKIVKKPPQITSTPLFEDENSLDNFPTNNIKYPYTVEVPLKAGGKPKESWMKEWTEEERIEKFFEFCRVFDLREDELLRTDYQIFSHRLHWHEHSYCDYMKKITDNKERLWYTLVFSFTNEHWKTLTTLVDKGEAALEERFKEHRHARNDLFQIYYPKGTIVKDWIRTGPKKAAEDMYHVLENLDRPYTMMEFAKIMEKYFKEEQGFRSPLYPCKNTARYLAMTWPDLVDPESILFGGTGHFDGLHQIFGGQNLNGKVKYSIDKDGQFICENKHADEWIRQMEVLASHPSNPIKEQNWLNLEDKTCFFYKHIAISHGIKSPTKRIPYNWIFDSNFDLAKHPLNEVQVNSKTTQHLWGRDYPEEV